METKPKLVLKKSGISGKGVYAKAPIKKEVLVVEYQGKRKRWTSNVRPLKGDYVNLMYTDDGFVIDPRIDGNIAQFINHSCEPNCESVLIGKRVYIESLRKIKANEEITYDYGLTLGRKPSKEARLRFPCYCGSRKCRGTLLKVSSSSSKQKK